MKKCPICGMEHDDNASFCTECGIKFEQHHNTYQQPQQEPQSEPRTAPTGEYIHSEQQDNAPVSMWDFTWMELLARIPVVNIVMFCIWGFSRDTNTNRKNWARSRLIWAAIGLVLSVVGISLALVAGGVFATVGSELFSSFSTHHF